LRRNLSGVLNWDVAKWRWQTYLLLWYVCASSIIRLGLFTERTHSCALKWQQIWMRNEIINNLLKNKWGYNTSLHLNQLKLVWSTAFLITCPQPVQKFPNLWFHKFIAMFTRAHHKSLFTSHLTCWDPI
jgi:hypothetical protein